MNKRLFTILAGIFAVLSFAACNDDDGIDPSSAEPTITYAYDALEADLNKVDNLPVVAVVKSEAGLQSVTLDILTADDERVPVKTVTEFFNRKSYSLSEKVNWEADYSEAVITAVDLLGRTVTESIPVSIIDVVAPPAIVFTPESWSYDETVGGEKARTHFVVTSASALKSIEMYRVTTEGQTQYGGTVTGGDTDPWTTYTFDEMIQYGETDKGFKVKATDIYDQVRIASMTVSYKTVPPPTVTFADAMIFADKDEKKAVNIDIESLAGIVQVELFRLEGKTETSVSTKTYDKLHTLNYAEEMVFTNATSGVKVIVTDNVGRTTTATTKAIVNMDYLESVEIGGIGYTSAKASRPDVYSLFSLKYMKTLPMLDVLDAAEVNGVADVDICYYNMSNVTHRIYSPDGEKSGEYKAPDGRTLKDLAAKPLTRFQVLTNVDFESATAASIANDVIASQLTLARIDSKVGDVIAFKTGSKSSAGGNRIGLMKILSIYEETTESGGAKNTNLSTVTVSIKFPKE